MMKPPRQKRKCNICGYPGRVTYTEIDRESGKRVTESHEVPCLGHDGIFPHLWNQHPQYVAYQNRFARLRAISRGEKVG